LRTLLLLAAVAWAVGSGGGTSTRDLLVIGILVVTANKRPNLQLSQLMWYLPVAALLLWMLIDGPLRTGLHLESIRLPALVAVATMAVRSVASFDYDDRETFLNGLIVLGFAQGAIALVQLAGTVQESPLALFSERASATIGSPNALASSLCQPPASPPVHSRIDGLRNYHWH
jgi:hypothetical protein